MILTAFHMKFDDKQNEIAPRACRPSKSQQKQKGELRGQRGSKMEEKIIMSRATGCFPKSEFDTMWVSIWVQTHVALVYRRNSWILRSQGINPFTCIYTYLYSLEGSLCINGPNRTQEHFFKATFQSDDGGLFGSRDVLNGLTSETVNSSWQNILTSHCWRD